MHVRYPLLALAMLGLVGCDAGEVAHAPPESAATEVASAPSFYDRLVDPAGPVPGLAGFSIVHKSSKTHCGGIEIVTFRPSQLAGADDAVLAKVYALEFPAGLDFDPTHEQTQQASMRRFSDWLETLQSVGLEARTYYETQLAATGDVADAARLALVDARLSSVLGRAVIPEDIRTGEYADDKIKAYCDAMATAAEPLLAKAEQAIRACANAASTKPDGRWSALCPART